MRIFIHQIFLLASFFIFSAAAGQSSLPAIKLKAINGNTLSLKTVIETDSIVIVSFWATWCVPCINELDAIQERIQEKEKDTSFRIIAISTDEARTVHRVKPMVKAKGWSFDVYLDESNEVKRAFNVNNIPFVLVINKGKTVYQRSGYMQGDEEILFDKIKQLSAGN